MEKYIQLSKIKPESITNTTQEKGERQLTTHHTQYHDYVSEPVILIVQCANQITANVVM